jgi:hypothetical protein
MFDPTPMSVLLSTLIPIGVACTIVGSVALATYHWRALESQRIGGQLVQKMLDRGLSGEEIERILIAWSRDSELASKLLQQKTPPVKKYVG